MYNNSSQKTKICLGNSVSRFVSISNSCYPKCFNRYIFMKNIVYLCLQLCSFSKILMHINYHQESLHQFTCLHEL